MRPAEQLSPFVREALARGRPREEIAAALTGAGWSAAEAQEALAAWGDAGDGGALPPIPRPPRQAAGAREGFWYGLMFVGLATVAWHLGLLAFTATDALVPDPLDAGTAAVDRFALRWSTAALIVFTPVTLWIAARIEREARANPGRRRSGVRGTLGQAALLVTALVLLDDALAAIYALLSGELTPRFLFKAGAVAVIAVATLAFVRAATRDAPDAAAHAP